MGILGVSESVSSYSPVPPLYFHLECLICYCNVCTLSGLTFHETCNPNSTLLFATAICSHNLTTTASLPQWHYCYGTKIAAQLTSAAMAPAINATALSPRCQSFQCQQFWLQRQHPVQTIQCNNTPIATHVCQMTTCNDLQQFLLLPTNFTKAANKIILPHNPHPLQQPHVRYWPSPPALPTITTSSCNSATMASSP